MIPTKYSVKKLQLLKYKVTKTIFHNTYERRNGIENSGEIQCPSSGRITKKIGRVCRHKIFSSAFKKVLKV